MNSYSIANYKPADVRNAGIAREWADCASLGIERSAHDSTDYRSASDIMLNERHISVKASGFTLMSGTMCEGEESFEGIWNVYKRNTHSNEWHYVTESYVVYAMNLGEFESFIRAFGRTERESEKNGGQMKIRLRKESKKMLEWLARRAAPVGVGA